MKLMNVYFVVVILLTSLEGATQLKHYAPPTCVEDIPAYCATILGATSRSDEQAVKLYDLTPLEKDAGFWGCSNLGSFSYAFARNLPLPSPHTCSLVAYFTSLAKEVLNSTVRTSDWVVSHQPGIRHARPFYLPPDKPDMPKKAALDSIAPAAYRLYPLPDITAAIDTMNKVGEEEYRATLAAYNKELSSPCKARTFLSYPENFSELSLLYNENCPPFTKAILEEIFTQALQAIKTNWTAKAPSWEEEELIPWAGPSDDLAFSKRCSVYNPSTSKACYSSDTHYLIVQSTHTDNSLAYFISSLLEMFLPAPDIYTSNTWTSNKRPTGAFHGVATTSLHRGGSIAPRWRNGQTYILIPHHLLQPFIDTFKFSIDFSALEPVSVDEVMPVLSDEEKALFSPAPSSVSASAAFSSPSSVGFMSPSDSVDLGDKTPSETTPAAKKLDFHDDNDTVSQLDLSFDDS